jgi:dTDP-4-amino-4,6-dideoxy-D-galactose acyltransferase
MYLLIDSRDANGIRLASKFGWRMVDMRVRMGARISGAFPDANGVRQAESEDIPFLRQLAKNSHRESRFYADGNFSEAACDDLFALWIERSVRDRDFAGSVFVSQTLRGEPTGYITCGVKDGIGQIGLVAVAENVRRMGLGTQLLRASANWFTNQGIERISVVTQGCNLAALRTYQHFGFTIDSIDLWFHWWRQPRP